VDLLIATAPETFLCVECKTAERILPGELKGIQRLAEEYGAKSMQQARVVCRSERAYPLEGKSGARAEPLGGPEGLLAELAAII
jgi:hypothetical protein